MTLQEWNLNCYMILRQDQKKQINLQFLSPAFILILFLIYRSLAFKSPFLLSATENHCVQSHFTDVHSHYLIASQSCLLFCSIWRCRLPHFPPLCRKPSQGYLTSSNQPDGPSSRSFLILRPRFTFVTVKSLISFEECWPWGRHWAEGKWAWAQIFKSLPALVFRDEERAQTDRPRAYCWIPWWKSAAPLLLDRYTCPEFL